MDETRVLQIISIVSLSIGGLCALIIAIDIITVNKQKMMIMNFVYPIAGLYGSIFALLFYFTIRRKSSAKNDRQSHSVDNQAMQHDKKPFDIFAPVHGRLIILLLL